MEVVIGKEQPPRIIKPESPKDDQWKKNERSKPPQHPKATFDILMAKYKEDRADIRGCKNWTIQNAKSDNPVSLSQASSFAGQSSFAKRSRTPPWWNSEGQDRRQ
jgi:hypothetical protein